MDTPTTVRLNKYIATATGLGRRHVDELIERGRVTVDGQQARLGQQIDPAQATVTVNGKNITDTAASQHTYIMLNKPAGYVCSRRSQGGDPTIYQLLPQKFHKLKSVGRLDRDSSGLLLLTDDGTFAHRLTHPSFRKVKVYEIKLDNPLEPLHRQMISDHGITLDDGRSQLQLERLTDGDDTVWRVTMHEGRNRQIRRTFAALGYTVISLHRIAFGRYSLGDLTPGESVVVSANAESID